MDTCSLRVTECRLRQLSQSIYLSPLIASISTTAEGLEGWKNYTSQAMMPSYPGRHCLNVDISMSAPGSPVTDSCCLRVEDEFRYAECNRRVCRVRVAHRMQDYTKVRAYRVISLLDVISKLLERTAAHLIVDHLERKKGLHEGQFGCRKRRSCVDAVAILMNRRQKAWGEKKVAEALFMDVKSAFNNVCKAHLGKRMETLGIESDLIRWTMSFMSDRQVKIVLDGEVGEASPVDTGVPQGSPTAPILFCHVIIGHI